MSRKGDLEKLKVWTNTDMGETWEEPGTRIDGTELFNRREIYEAEVPEGVIVLTAGVDVQKDRFEVEVVGWGVGKESWGIRYTRIWGGVLKEQAWEDLDRFLLSPSYKKDGTVLYITCSGWDLRRWQRRRTTPCWRKSGAIAVRGCRLPWATGSGMVTPFCENTICSG